MTGKKLKQHIEHLKCLRQDAGNQRKYRLARSYQVLIHRLEGLPPPDQLAFNLHQKRKQRK